MSVRMRLFAAAAVCALLSGCGGGSGGVSSASSAPPPPPPSNTSLADLHANQQFDTVGANTTTSFDTSKDVVLSAASTPATVSVSYDAGTESYTVSANGRSETFNPSEIQSGTLTGETRYMTAGSGGSDYLTLVVKPYTGMTPNRYVGLGYWQHDDLSGSTQNTQFDSFVYGFATPATAVPKTGTAGYVTDVFGLLTTPGIEPKSISGSGTFQVDFDSGLFQTQAYISEYTLTKAEAATGGGIYIQSDGHLSSGNGFSGNVAYSGFDGTMAGTMSGSFYGPNAEEMGASFSATNASGAALTGSMTGQRSAGQAPVSQSLTNIVADTQVPERFTEWTTGSDTSETPVFRGSIGYDEEDPGRVTLRQDGSATIQLSNSMATAADVTAADRSATQRPNFNSYDTVVNGQPVHIDLYKPGSANSELALTYASFGIWSSPFQNGTYSQLRNDFFVYGFETPQYLLSQRTGTGSYDGVVYGSTSTVGGTTEDVGGTSHFDVNFGAQKFSGALDLFAQPGGGAPQVSLGTWTFADQMVHGQMVETTLLKNGVPGVGDLAYHSIDPRFYGPDGEEIAATFSIQNGYAGTVGTTAITGVTVAKRH